jgi:hypothetical protein
MSEHKPQKTEDVPPEVLEMIPKGVLLPGGAQMWWNSVGPSSPQSPAQLWADGKHSEVRDLIQSILSGDMA